MSEPEKLRREILEILYANVTESMFDSSSVDRDRLYKALSYPKRKIDKSIYNLESRKLIKLHIGIFEEEWSSASITDEGIEYFESDEFEDATYSPASNVAHQTINVEGDFIGSVSQTQKGDILNIDNITKTFDQARKIVKSDNELDDYDKEEIIEYLDSLKEEAKKEEPDEDTVRDLWGWIEEYAPQAVISLIIEIVVKILSNLVI